MSCTIDVEIEWMDRVVKRCMQALIDCGMTGCFIDIEWARSNNIPTWPLTNLIPVYNIDRTANKTDMIVKIADLVLCYDNHSEHTHWVCSHSLGQAKYDFRVQLAVQPQPKVKCLAAPCSALPAVLKANVIQSLTRWKYHRSTHANLEHSPPWLRS
jgi:hypothetical protein